MAGVKAVGALIRVANSTVIETTGDTAVGIASGISGAASSRVKVVAKGRVEVAGTACWGINVTGS